MYTPNEPDACTFIDIQQAEDPLSLSQDASVRESGASSSREPSASSPPPSKRSSREGSESSVDFHSVDEKVVYEDQLTKLQEQLVAAMIDNQNLSKCINVNIDSSCGA